MDHNPWNLQGGATSQYQSGTPASSNEFRDHDATFCYESTYWQIFEAVELQRSSRFRRKQIIEGSRLQSYEGRRCELVTRRHMVIEARIVKVTNSYAQVIILSKYRVPNKQIIQ